MARRGWGAIRKLPSGRYQASYTGPDLARHVAPMTFESKAFAEAWLTGARREIEDETWGTSRSSKAKAKRRVTIAEAFETYLRKPRKRPLTPRTEAHYRQVYTARIEPQFGALGAGVIQPETVEAWFYAMNPKHPTARAHAYALLNGILMHALPKGTENPCQIQGGSTSETVRKIIPATLAELDVMEAAMPPSRSAMIPLAAWCALRFGEVTELRRRDIHLEADAASAEIERAVTWVAGKAIVGVPKAESARTVAIPPHIAGKLQTHLDLYVGKGAESLLFPAERGGHMMHTTLANMFRKARIAAGRPDLHFHDLRHTGATLAARAGATLTEQMARLGHKTPQMAIRYQHAAADRDRVIADALSALATGAK